MAPTPNSAMAFPTIDNTLGALLVGGLLAMALWGVTCVQTFTFFMQKTRDTPLFKFIIALLWCLDTWDSATNCHFLYYYFVTNYLNPAAAFRPVWSLIIHVANTAVSGFFIRAMFALRFYQLSERNVPFTILILAISATDLAVGIVITVKAFGITSYVDLKSISNLFYLNFAATLASDLAVTVGLATLLLLSKTGFRRTDSLINTLMMYMVNTGLLVVIDAALGMIAYLALPQSLIFYAFYLFQSKLYFNSYLAMLNARGDLRSKSEEPVSIHLSQLSGSRAFAQSDSSVTSPTTEKTFQPHHNEMAITVQTRVEKRVDESAGSRNSSFVAGMAY